MITNNEYSVTKNKINNVALKLFNKNGIKATSIRQIAKDVGITEGAIYKHFESKDQIAYEIFEFYMINFRELLLDESGKTSEPGKKIILLVEAFFDFAKNYPMGYTYIMIGHYTQLTKLKKDFIKPKDIFEDCIREGIKKNIFRKNDPNLAVAMVVGLLTRTILFRQNNLIDLNDDLILEEITSSVIKLLK